ncbi:cell division protein FtsQ [Pasteurellaceae bacterium Macca]|nr:cell division protein FtsQ [Pasteurellaceae bacterium Macca]
MKYSRRQFVKSASLASLGVVAPQLVFAKERPKLPIPTLIDVGRGRPVRLDFRVAQREFVSGKLVDVWGVNGLALPPTVRMKSGDFVKLTYLNSLPQALSINIQGLLAPTEMVGSIHRKLEKNSHWSPIISTQQGAFTGWYHANTMLNSAYQVYRGIGGMWIVEDSASRQASLPNKYGVNDIPLILQDQQLNSNGVQLFYNDAKPFFGKTLFVNGQRSPSMTLPRGWVRLRIVNASLSRAYDLRLDNGKPLHLIATGMGMLAECVEMPSVLLAPSERMELLVDLSDGQVVSLISGEKRDFFYTLGQLFQRNDDLEDNVILEMHPEGLLSVFNITPTLPTQDRTQFHLKIAQERKFNLRPLDRLINQQRFDPKRLDAKVKLNTTERWIIHTSESVGFTLQGAKFIVETRQQKAEPIAQLAWRDTVWIEKDQTVTLLVKFEQTASPQQPFTFGVSDLMLRDKGCMGQFSVE